jgi:flagellar basal body L-ring protein FlgH
MVMIGYEAGTKAYRAYNPVNKKLVVTRDVLFEEEKSWNWSSAEPVQSISDEIFTVVYSDLRADDQGDADTHVTANSEAARADESMDISRASSARTALPGAGKPDSSTNARPGASAPLADSPRESFSSRPARGPGAIERASERLFTLS